MVSMMLQEHLAEVKKYQKEKTAPLVLDLNKSLYKQPDTVSSFSLTYCVCTRLQQLLIWYDWLNLTVSDSSRQN